MIPSESPPITKESLTQSIKATVPIVEDWQAKSRRENRKIWANLATAGGALVSTVPIALADHSPPTGIPILDLAKDFLAYAPLGVALGSMAQFLRNVTSTLRDVYGAHPSSRELYDQLTQLKQIAKDALLDPDENITRALNIHPYESLPADQEEIGEFTAKLYERILTQVNASGVIDEDHKLDRTTKPGEEAWKIKYMGYKLKSGESLTISIRADIEDQQLANVQDSSKIARDARALVDKERGDISEIEYKAILAVEPTPEKIILAQIQTPSGIIILGKHWDTTSQKAVYDCTNRDPYGDDDTAQDPNEDVADLESLTYILQMTEPQNLQALGKDDISIPSLPIPPQTP